MPGLASLVGRIFFLNLHFQNSVSLIFAGENFENLKIVCRWMLFFFVLFNEKLLDEQLF